MNTDRLRTGGDPERLRRAAYRIISRTQDDPATQVKGMALALYATCDALGVDIRELLSTIDRMKADLDGPFVGTFDAIREYARGEIGR